MSIKILVVSISLILSSVALADGHKTNQMTEKKMRHHQFNPSWNIEVFGGRQDPGVLEWAALGFDVDRGNVRGLAVSKYVRPRLALGLEYSKSKNFYTGFPNYISSQALMITTDYDLIRRGAFTGYGSIGLGMVRPVYEQIGNLRFGETVAGGLIALGAHVNISPRTSLFVEARYIESKDFDIEGAGIAGLPAGTKAEFNGESAVIGFRYSF